MNPLQFATMGKPNQSCFIRKPYIESSYALSRSLLMLNCYADCIGIQQPSLCGEDNLSNYNSRGLVTLIAAEKNVSQFWSLDKKIQTKATENSTEYHTE